MSMDDRTREVPTGSEIDDVERVFDRLERAMARRRRPARARA